MTFADSIGLVFLLGIVGVMFLAASHSANNLYRTWSIAVSKKGARKYLHDYYTYLSMAVITFIAALLVVISSVVVIF